MKVHILSARDSKNVRLLMSQWVELNNNSTFYLNQWIKFFYFRWLGILVRWIRFIHWIINQCWTWISFVFRILCNSDLYKGLGYIEPTSCRNNTISFNRIEYLSICTYKEDFILLMHPLHQMKNSGRNTWHHSNFRSGYRIWVFQILYFWSRYQIKFRSRIINPNFRIKYICFGCNTHYIQ